MDKNVSNTPKLEFSNKYDSAHAQQYFSKHQDGLMRRLSNRRDQQICRKALNIAGNPASVLDMPCGTGRFWDLLAEDPNRQLYASDFSQDMIDTALQHRHSSVVSRFNTFQASAFDLPVDDNFVESVFCIRLIHHMGASDDRVKLLKELARVTSDTVIISLWVDGNIKAWRRRRLEQKRGHHDYQNRFVINRKLFEQEVGAAGLKVKAKLDFIPGYAMWRTYVLTAQKS